MAKANYKPINLTDETLSMFQDHVASAFSNVDTATALSVKTVTSQYTVGASDDVVLADPTRASFAVVLPDPRTFSGPVSLRKVGSSTNAVTVRPASPSVTIDGSASITLDKATVVSDGANYWTV